MGGEGCVVGGKDAGQLPDNLGSSSCSSSLFSPEIIIPHISALEYDTLQARGIEVLVK